MLPSADCDAKGRLAEEHALCKLPWRFDSWFDDNPLPMMVFDRESLTILAVNQAAIDHYGYSRQEFLELTIKEIRPPEETSRLGDIMRREAVGFRGPFLGRHRKKDGTIFDVEVYAQREALRTSTIVLAQIHDVTVRRRAMLLDQAVACRRLSELRDRLSQGKLYLLEEELGTEYTFGAIIGESPAWKRVLKQVETVAETDSTGLILGETGTGKELIARAIHRLSARRERALVKVNCAAIPSGLLESELFGHEKGAFTGAISQKIGRLELAHGGTLFLDEVGDIPLELQPKLLRFLQEKEFERLGSTRTIRINVRLIAATNRNLAKMADEGEFRRDLYYRLNVFPIALPALRERAEDIPRLVRYFVEKLARRMNKRIDLIPAETMQALARWAWPGNVRELENFIERALILSEGQILHAPLRELESAVESRSAGSATLAAVEREHIIRTLRETSGVIGGPHGAAVRLGIPRTTLNNEMRKLGISRKDL